MPRVGLVHDDWYPNWNVVSPDQDRYSECDHYVEISEELLERWRAADAEYEAVQFELRKLRSGG